MVKVIGVRFRNAGKIYILTAGSGYRSGAECDCGDCERY